MDPAEELQTQPPVQCREATELDAAAIAVLHADSWRRHYRGALLDSYLDGELLADRVNVWRERLKPPRSDQYTVVAEREGDIVGFAHVLFDEDPRWGSLVDNLHVRSDLKRIGIGRLLLSDAAKALVRSRPSGVVHLWVLDQNTEAQSFYEALGGVRVETELRGPFPGGGQALGHRYAWAEPSLLIRSD